MRRSGLLVVLFCLGISTLVRADQWTKTFTLTGSPDLKVETSDANIHVDTWDQNTIEARVTTSRYKIGDNGIRITDRQSGNAVELDVRFPHHFITFSLGGYRVDIDIHMPRQGRVYLHTGDGSIRLSNLKGSMEIESGDGGEDILGVDGNLRAHTSDGHIRAEGRFDTLDLSSGDGRVDARALPGSKLAGPWNVRTGDGSVVLQLPDGLAADVDLHTGDGRINLEMPVTVEGNLSRNNVRGKLNGGGNPLVVHTGDGSIRLERS